MPVFMFWNVARNPLSKLIALAARDHAVEIIVLAENEELGARIVHGLNAVDGHQPWREFSAGVGRLKIFTKLPMNAIKLVSDSGHISIRSIEPPLGPKLLMVGVHLKSKLYADDADQHAEAQRLISTIRDAEKQVGHQRTMVIGDLNMDPYDPGMTRADGLHAVMAKPIALKRNRTVQEKPYDFFYNPMWSRLGDESHGPPGTYFLDRSGKMVNRFWSTFDQVLLRPQLLNAYDGARLHVLERIGETPLVRGAIVDKSISDHLPIVIGLETEREPAL